MCSLKGHGHWVNTMSLSTDYALRTGAFDHTGSAPADPEAAKAAAQARYDAARSGRPERLATGVVWWEGVGVGVGGADPASHGRRSMYGG